MRWYRRLARTAAMMALGVCVCAAGMPGMEAVTRGPVRVIDTQAGCVVFEGNNAESFVQALLAANEGYVSTAEQALMSAAPAPSRAAVERQPLVAVPLLAAGSVCMCGGQDVFPNVVLLHAQSYEGWRRGRGS